MTDPLSNSVTSQQDGAAGVECQRDRHDAMQSHDRMTSIPHYNHWSIVNPLVHNKRVSMQLQACSAFWVIFDVPITIFLLLCQCRLYSKQCNHKMSAFVISTVHCCTWCCKSWHLFSLYALFLIVLHITRNPLIVEPSIAKTNWLLPPFMNSHLAKYPFTASARSIAFPFRLPRRNQPIEFAA